MVKSTKNITLRLRGGKQCGATDCELPIDLLQGTDLEKPPRCLPSLAADCYEIINFQFAGQYKLKNITFILITRFSSSLARIL